MVTVLIADDEFLELQYLGRLFEQASDYRLVGRAQDGRQAVELAIKYRPDIIIMDINMPVSGLEAARLIRDAIPGQIIIINTAYASFEFARQSMELHLDAYLLKPANSAEIFSTIESCLRQKEHINLPVSAASVREQLQYPHGLLENMLRSISFMDSSKFSSASKEYLCFMDEHDCWNRSCNLFAINTIYSIARQMNKLELAGTTLELLDFDGCIAKLSCAGNTEMRALMKDFFCRIALGLQTVEPKTNDAIKIVCDYINSNFSENITLEHLAGISHFSEGYLSRLFHQQTGETISFYIGKVRIANAVKMLKYSNKSVSDIAISCGFGNVAHFHRMFKKHIGFTPLEIRNGKGSK